MKKVKNIRILGSPDYGMAGSMYIGAYRLRAYTRKLGLAVNVKELTGGEKSPAYQLMQRTKDR